MRCAFWVLASLLTVASAVASDAPEIVMGPNILVSRDGDVAHVEPILAVNPRNPANLVGAAITSTRPEGGMACRTYSSLDAGSTWSVFDFPDQIGYGGGDPQVVFTPHGTAIFLDLAFGSMKDDTGRDRGGMHVYRSTDGGRTWTGTVDICCSNDHPQVAVDTTLGEHAGRIYVGTLYGYPVYTVGIFRSDDDGRSFIGPVEAANGGGEIGINVVDIQVLSDGTLVVPYVDFEFKPEKAPKSGRTRMNIWFTSSPDGGLTFAKGVRSHAIEVNLDDPAWRQGAGVPAIAADSTNGKFKDRLFMAWADMRFGAPRILFSRSQDRGLTWSEPVLLDGEVPAASRQFMPEMTVNSSGVLGLLWLDTREHAEDGLFNAYFTASLDGGDTFLPAVKVSSAPSDHDGPGNVALSPGVSTYNGKVHLSFTSAASRWPAGGDYIGLVADRTGAFWPLWPDARTGTFQLYTAKLSVVEPPKPADDAAAGEAPPPTPEPAPRTSMALNDMVKLVFDPTRYAGENGTAEIPVRLKNVSKEAIYPPIVLEVIGFGFDFPGEEVDESKIPAVLGADNAETGVGAQLSFDGALGNLGELAAGALSGPVVIRLKLADPTETPSIQLAVTGLVEQR
jgi:hypothetical protein